MTLPTSGSPVRTWSLAQIGLVVQLVRIHACHAWGRGFESRPDRQQKNEGLAQLVAHHVWDVGVTGSSPGIPTMNIFFYWILISSFLVGTLVGFIISDYIK